MAAMTLLAGVWGGGCGKGTQARPDGGNVILTPGDVLGPGRHSFDVIAALSPVANGNIPPPSNTFTLVIDVDAGVAIAGGNGFAAVVALTTSDGRIFQSTGAFKAGDASATMCSGAQEVRYDTLEATVSNGVLTGNAAGVAMVSCGDCSIMIAFTARLSGTMDTTPPTLHLSGLVPASPFDSFTLNTSEPLPASASARLVGADGTSIDLARAIVPGSVPLIAGFSKPDIVLQAGQAYFVTFDGLVDFAGLVDPTGTPLGLTSFPAAPTVPQDGFESATGATLGGAMVMTTGGALPAITGSTSLYIGTAGAPALDLANGRSLMVRLARQSGTTMLLFSYRMTSWAPAASFPGILQVGSEGASASPAAFPFGSTAPMNPLTIDGLSGYASAVATASVALPADATDQVLVSVAPGSTVCGPRAAFNTGLLIDDLRLE